MSRPVFIGVDTTTYRKWMRFAACGECFEEWQYGLKEWPEYNPRKRGVCPLCNRWNWHDKT